VTRDSRFDDFAGDILDPQDVQELEAARTPAKRPLTAKQIAQRQRAGLAYAAKLSPADKKEIGERLDRDRRAHFDRLRAEGKIPVRKENRKSPSLASLDPWIEKVFEKYGRDIELTPNELRREALLLMRIAAADARDES
jgi:hypothetical protein